MAKTGRLPKYNEECVGRIYEALRSGCGDLDAAKAGGISKDTFYTWLKEKPDFIEVVKNAKREFREWEMNGILSDAKKSLKTLICGFEYEEVKSEYGRKKSEKDDPHDADELVIIRKTITTKRVLPSTTAVIFALCNRDPERWQNRVTNDITAKVDADAKADVSLANVPDELLAQVLDAIKEK